MPTAFRVLPAAVAARRLSVVRRPCRRHRVDMLLPPLLRAAPSDSWLQRAAAGDGDKSDDDEDEDDAPVLTLLDDDDDEDYADSGDLVAEGMDLLYGGAENDNDDDDDNSTDAATDDETTLYAPPGVAAVPPRSGGDAAAYVDAVITTPPPPPALMAAVLAAFPFPLDRFQRRAARASITGRDVVVCAPTGAGKTAIAVAAALAALARGKRVVYTTPLKALSNQKLGELRTLFGVARVGLQTGDATINPDADIVVMTTEVLRNILLRVPVAADEGVTPGGGGGDDAPPAATTLTLDADTPPPPPPCRRLPHRAGRSPLAGRPGSRHGVGGGDHGRAARRGPPRDVGDCPQPGRPGRLDDRHPRSL